jgi:hypothetical protein
VTLNLLGDWSVVDDSETVTYFQRTAEAGFATGVSVPNCLRRVTTQDDLALHGALLTRVGLVWHVWAANLPGGLVPQERDVIQDAASARWSILRVEYQSLLSRYRLTCVRER